MKLEREVFYKITLTSDELKWLRSLVQNPIPTQDNPKGLPEKESPLDKEMRYKFWTILKGELPCN